MSDNLLHEIERFGATPEQIVDLAVPTPRALQFSDLVRAPEVGRAPVVVEAKSRPLIYVFDGRDCSDENLPRWVRRIAFRGEADWVGVLRPGRLDVFPAVLDSQIALQPIEDLPEGAFRIPALVHQTKADVSSVRSRLRTLLFASIKRAREDFGLTSRDALALVGGSLFWRFLVDRDLLAGLAPSQIAPKAETWTECLDNKQRGVATLQWLDKTFNGGLLSFESSKRQLPAEVFSKVAGDIAHKTDAHGQLSLPDKWAQIDFAHVPVGLLSEVYEAVVHDRNKQRATERSLFYTPRHLAEYVVDEVLDAVDGVEKPRILDPAAGAGVFLVAAFRALVAREWRRKGSRPTRRVVRRILSDQLVGFDIDGDALRLAELALYLTAIELDPDKNPRPLDVLRFDSLRGKVLVEQNSGHGIGSLGPVPEGYRGKFDAVVGNPPWTALKNKRDKGTRHRSAAMKKAWADASRSVVRERLGAERARAFDFPDMNPDLPFVFRALEWTRPAGCIGLLTHARWLFNQSGPALRVRRDLLESTHVTGVLNGSALRMTKVWPNVTAPFCIVFATNEPPPDGAAFQYVSPDLDTSDPGQDRIRIDWSDAAVLDVEQVIEKPWTLKTLFRGSMVDAAIVEDLALRGTPLGEYLTSLGTRLANGYQTPKSEEPKSARGMRHLPDLGSAELEFFVDPKRLAKFSHKKLHRPRDPEIYHAPLLIVHESFVVKPGRARAGLALQDIAYDERFDGVSFADNDEGVEIASYLQLVLNSSVFVHSLLMLDSQFGVEREVVHLETLKRVPIVPWNRLTQPQKRRTAKLSKLLRNGMNSTLQKHIDSFVARVYGLSNTQAQVVADTLSTALPTREAKKAALRRTRQRDRDEFSRICEEALSDVLSASSLAAFVRVRDDLPGGVWRFVQIDRVGVGDAAPALKALPTRDLLLAADEGAASLVMLHVDQTTTLAGILDRYGYWTPTRARLLASLLLGGGGG